MNAHYFQHVPFEGLGSIEAWLRDAGYAITCTRFFESPDIPDLSGIDLLIVMGGPMSVNDEAEFPWLVQEKGFIREAVQAGKPVLGVCLGAQLIASALGAKVSKNPVKEIGWFPIQGLSGDERAVFRFPPETTVFHWHGDTFDLPAGAIRLARSPACVNQAFQVGRATLGLQFHLETTPESAAALVANCRAELIPADYVQSEARILAAEPETYRAINALMDAVLAFLHHRAKAA